MKERLLKLVNHIYFGIYLYPGEAFYPIFLDGERTYYKGFWGFKFCYIMVFLYAYGILSVLGHFMGEKIAYFVSSSFVYKLVFIIITIGLTFIIERITSLGGKKGLNYFEQFTKEPRFEKIKWMIVGAVAFIVGIGLFIIGIKAFFIY